MEDTCKIIDYSNVFLSYFDDNASKYEPMIREHGMVYILSGKLEINEGGKITCLRKGECAFVRKDNRVSMNKMPQKG
ncbi:MAG: AraC family transcriptional regulator, partial [Dysgonamonadaceae bacterium]|nr:AraC family transcriptional regulator [Dysgonamonadaceae bacterium]